MALYPDKLRLLVPTRWPLILEAAAAVLMARLLLDRQPYKKVDDLYVRWAQKLRRSAPSSEEEWKEIVRAIRGIGRRTLGDRPCLPEALAGRLMLSRRGYDAELHIGVRRDDQGELTAHAWLQSGTCIVIGGSQSPLRFSKLEHVHASGERAAL